MGGFYDEINDKNYWKEAKETGELDVGGVVEYFDWLVESMAESVHDMPGVFNDGEDGNESEDSESAASIGSRAREEQLRLGEDFSDQGDKDDLGLSLSDFDDNGGDGGDDSEDSSMAESVHDMPD